MRICAYPGCRHIEKEGSCRMHRVPASPKATKQWMTACHWLGSPKKLPVATYLCSCHFNGGQGPSKEHKFPDVCQEDVPWIVIVEGRKGSLRGKNMGPRIRSKKKVSSASLQVTPITSQEHTPVTHAFTSGTPNVPEQSGSMTNTNAVNLAGLGNGNDYMEMESSGSNHHYITEEMSCNALLEVENKPAQLPPVRSLLLGSNETPGITTHDASASASFGAEVISEEPSSSGQASASVDFTEIGAPQILLRPYLDLAVPLKGRPKGRPVSVLTGDAPNFVIRRPKKKRPDVSSLARSNFIYNAVLIDGSQGTVLIRIYGHDESEYSGNDGKNAVESILQTDLPFLSYERCRHWSIEDFKHLTGISQDSFEVLFKLLGGDEVCSRLKYRYEQPTPQRQTHPTHSPAGLLFLTLVRLRRGFTLTSMRMFFGVDESVVSRVFTAWIKLMSLKFKSMEDALFVSVSAQAANTPDCYKAFPNLRCVVDAFEIYIQKPENMEQQSCTFSTYKHRNTVKFLLVSSHYGGVSMISDGIEGSASDRKLFMKSLLKSGILRHLNSGEAVMADRGFDVEPELNERGIDLIIPPFLGGRDAFTQRELMFQKSVAAARSHVETVIGRVENNRLIGEKYPNTMLDILPDVVRVAAHLVNFSDPFIRWDQKAHKFVDIEKQSASRNK